MTQRHQTEANVTTANAGALCERLVFRRPQAATPPGNGFIHLFCRIAFIALFCLLCPVAAHAAGEYRTVEVSSLRIIMDSEWCYQTAPGYWPIRFDITNLGDDRVIELRGQVMRWWNMGEMGGLDFQKSIRLKRSDHVKFTIPVPISADNENGSFQILERGRHLQSFSFGGFQGNKPEDKTGALIIADPATAFGAMASSLPRPLSMYGGATPPLGSRGPYMDLVLDPARLPSDWLGLTSVAAVFIGPQEWEKLTGPQKEALLTWTASGGDFAFVDGDMPALLPDPQTRPGNLSLNEYGQTSYYFGRIHLLKSAELKTGGLNNAFLRLHNTAGYGDRALPVNRSSDWSEAAASIYGPYGPPMPPYPTKSPTFGKNGFRLPIPGIGNVPVRPYLIILLVFSVLIGPVNYFWLWRKRRQILLVFTVPLISAAFILLLSGYVILGEGFDITGRAESITLLDQKTNHAATRATVSMYAAGMAPRNGLQFSRGTAVFPLGTGIRGNTERLLLDLTNLQQFSAGIAIARTPANFEEISFHPARERLSFNNADGRMTVVNALGATITRLYYRDGGKVFMLDQPLKAGEKALLHYTDKTGLGELPLKFHFLQGIQDEHTYIAWLEKSPFLETGAPDVKERDSLHLVLGYVGE